MIAGISSAKARRRGSAPFSGSRASAGSAAAARPEVDVIRKVSGMSASVVSQNSCAVVRARAAMPPVIRAASPLDWIAEQQDQFHCRIISGDPLGAVWPVEVDRRRLAPQTAVVNELSMICAIIGPQPVDVVLVIEEMRFLDVG